MIGLADALAPTDAPRAHLRIPLIPRTPAADETLAARVHAALQECGRTELRSLLVRATSAGKVVLTGEVSTYFLKQAAQVVSGRIAGVESVQNLVAVRSTAEFAL